MMSLRNFINLLWDLIMVIFTEVKCWVGWHSWEYTYEDRVYICTNDHYTVDLDICGTCGKKRYK